jgi:hypothetical protein
MGRYDTLLGLGDNTLKPQEQAAVPQQQAVSTSTQPISQQPERPNARISERVNARTLERANGKRIITRNSFEVYEDQMDSLRDRSYQEKRAGKLGSMSAMVRAAIDAYLKKNSSPDL